MIALAEQREQRRRAREQAGADRHTAKTVFELAEGFLPIDGDVTAVDTIGLGAEFARLAADLAHMVHAVVEVSRAAIDRRIDGAHVKALHLVAVAACNQFGDVFHNRLLIPGTLRRLDLLSSGRGQAEFQAGSPRDLCCHKPACRGAAQQLVRSQWRNQGRILNSVAGRYRRPMSRFLPRFPSRGFVPESPLNPWHETISVHCNGPGETLGGLGAALYDRGALVVVLMLSFSRQKRLFHSHLGIKGPKKTAMSQILLAWQNTKVNFTLIVDHRCYGPMLLLCF